MKGCAIRFTLLNVIEQVGSLVSGSWLQNHVGTLDSACEAARATEAVNGNRIDVAVVAAISSPCAILSYWRDLTRLDIYP